MSKLFSKNHQQTTLEETQEEEINTSYLSPYPSPINIGWKNGLMSKALLIVFLFMRV